MNAHVIVSGADLRGLVEAAHSAGIETLTLRAEWSRLITPGWTIGTHRRLAFKGYIPFIQSDGDPGPYVIDVARFRRAKKASEWDAVAVTIATDEETETVLLAGDTVLRADNRPKYGAPGYESDIWGNITQDKKTSRAMCPVDAWKGALNKAWKSPRHIHHFPLGDGSHTEDAVKIGVGLGVRNVIYIDGVCLDPMEKLPFSSVYYPLKSLRGLRTVRGGTIEMELVRGDEPFPMRLCMDRQTPGGKIRWEYIIAPCPTEEVEEAAE